MSQPVEIENFQERRTAFNSVAESYDSIRPSYPASLFEKIDAIVTMPDRGKALEIGIGTGQITAHFLDRSLHVTALDIAPDMLDIAQEKLRGRDCDFILSSFENFSAPDDSFDIVYAAQSFHWIDPAQGYDKAARLLHKNGSLILIWNVKKKFAEPEEASLQKIYETHAPSLCSKPEGRAPFVHVSVQNARIMLEKRCDLFPVVQEVSSEWTKDYTTQEYLRLLGSYSDHITLDASSKTALFDAVAQWVDAKGGVIPITYETVAFVAQKTGPSPAP